MWGRGWDASASGGDGDMVRRRAATGARIAAGPTRGTKRLTLSGSVIRIAEVAAWVPL